MNRTITNFSKAVCGLFLTALSTSITFAQTSTSWECLKRPVGGDVWFTTVVEDVLYAGVNNGGLYRSTDFGETWERFTNIPEQNITAVIKEGDRLYVGIYNAPIHYSTDNGASFKKLDSNFDTRTQQGLEIKGDTIYVANFNGLHISYDAGVNWKTVKLLSVIGSDWLHAVRKLNKKLFVATYGGVAYSNDEGANWTKVNINDNDFRKIEGHNGSLYITAREGVYVSTDNAATWQVKNNGLEDHSPYDLFFENGNIYASGTDGIYLSENNGNNWEKISYGLGSSIIYTTMVHDIHIHDGVLYAAAYNDGLYKSANGGLSWDPLNEGLYGYDIRYIEAFGDTVVTGDANGDLKISTDKGLNFEYLDEAGSSTLVLKHNAQTGLVYATGNRSINIYRPATKRMVASLRLVGAYESVQDVAFYNGNVFLLTNEAIYKGDTPLGPFNRIYVTTVPVHKFAISGNRMILSNQGPNVVVTADLNAPTLQFSKANGFEFSSLNGVTAFTSNTNYLYAATNDGIWQSGDNGLNWKRVTPTSIKTILDIRAKGSSLYAALGSNKALTSSNDGATWTTMNRGLNTEVLRTVAVGDGYVFGGTGGTGTWRYAIAQNPLSLSTEDITNNQFQVYPNPSTGIVYLRGLEGEQAFSVTTLAGEEIMSGRVANEQLDLSTLPAGMYLFKSGQHIGKVVIK